MKFLSELESNLEKYIEGLFRGRLKGGVEPAYIAKCLTREMRGRKRSSVDRTYVPNEYLVYLATPEFQTQDAVMRQLEEEMAWYLSRLAGNKGYHPVGNIMVKFIEEPDLEPGNLRVESSFVSSDGQQITAGNTDSQGVSEDTVKFRPLRQGGPASARQAAPRACLVVEEGAYRGKRLPLDTARQVLGRRESCDIVLPDSSVSRRHACLEFAGGNFYISDLDSANGTYVNGTRIKRHELKSGDEVVLGTCRFVFEVF